MKNDDFSPTAIKNINRLLKSLRDKLNSRYAIVDTESKVKDKNGNVVYIDFDIFSVDTMINCICSSLTFFNQIPLFTEFTFDDTEFVDNNASILIQGAFIFLLASKSLIESGKEFIISDDGCNFMIPTVSETLSTIWGPELTVHAAKIKRLKLPL